MARERRLGSRQEDRLDYVLAINGLAMVLAVTLPKLTYSANPASSPSDARAGLKVSEDTPPSVARSSNWNSKMQPHGVGNWRRLGFFIT